MAVSFFIRNKKAKIATLFARIRSKAKDIDIKASTITLKPLKVKHFQGLIFYGDRFGGPLENLRIFGSV